MSKAYDRVEWIFSSGFFANMVFLKFLVDLIYRSLCNNWYSIHINGDKTRFFTSSRGLRQGVPLSPSLVVIIQDALSRRLKYTINNGSLKSYHVPSSSLTVSHLMFADDMLLFTNGGKRSLQCFKAIYEEYEAALGQLMNVDKTSLIPTSKRVASYSTRINTDTVFVASSFPIKYLGVPLFKGKGIADYFDDLITKVHKKLAGWKTLFLSAGGKLTMIKSVLCSIPIYTMVVLHVPKSVTKELDQIYANF